MDCLVSKISLSSLPPTITGMSLGSMISVSSLYPDDGRRQILSCDLLSTNILTHDQIARPYLIMNHDHNDVDDDDDIEIAI